MLQLYSENADRDLTTLATVLAHPPDVSRARPCPSYVQLGDGAKDLDGSRGIISGTVALVQQTVQATSQAVAFTVTPRSVLFTALLTVPAGQEARIQILSPNAADTNVDATAACADELLTASA